MKDERSAPVQRCTGQVRSLCYLLDEPIATLTIQVGGQMITACASGQIAQDLRALPRGATIYVMLHDVSPDTLEIIAFSVIADDDKQNPNARSGDG
ncbi:MAG: hypothetical protein M3R61_14955 [Chloroflexota bacterium]|nr:hypothetical protein [Chloroflexota bacterium]